jgi:hypothetical protein
MSARPLERSETFDLGDVLSVTTGRCIGPGGMNGVRAVLDFLAGRSLYTHELPGARDVYGPHLVKRWPHLAVDVPESVQSMWQCVAFLHPLKVRHGDTLTITLVSEVQP